MTDTSHEDVCTFLIISCWTLLRMRDVRAKAVEQIKAHISENCGLYECGKVW